jgi:hypothetical protein
VDAQGRLTAGEVAKMLRKPVEAVRELADPDHPDHLPCYRYEHKRTDGKPYVTLRFDPAEVRLWEEAHHV